MNSLEGESDLHMLVKKPLQTHIQISNETHTLHTHINLPGENQVYSEIYFKIEAADDCDAACESHTNPDEHVLNMYMFTN